MTTTPAASPMMPSALTLTRDPISLILPFLTLREFACSGVAISRVWYSTAQSMRSRHDFTRMKYFDENNQQQYHLLASSPLRYHVTSLRAEVCSPTVVDTAFNIGRGGWTNMGLSIEECLKSQQAIVAAAAHHPNQHQQLKLLNTITQTMAHLESLSIHFLLLPGDISDVDIQSESIEFPLHLRCLKFETTILPQIWDERIMQGQNLEVQRLERWIVRLFKAVTNSAACCSTLRILESKLNERTTFQYPNSVVTSTSLHKLQALHRLALEMVSVPHVVDNAFLDAIRAIPQLSEFRLKVKDKLAYLLRAPCKQSYRRIGTSALINHLPIIFGDSEKKPIASVPSFVHPDLLLTSSAHSLIDLTAKLEISPEFLPRFTQLRSLSIFCRHEMNWDAPSNVLVPKTFSSEDLASALSQCLTLERLLIDWNMTGSNAGELTESHMERIVVPLLRLEYLSLTGHHQVHSLAFMTKLPHLVSGLHYFNFVGRLSSLSEYRMIYLLPQLRLLCLDHRHNWDPQDIAAWELQTGVTPFVLDAMFGPRKQLIASWPLRGPGELPDEYCPHLQHFIQSDNHRNILKEWQAVVDQVERVCEAELLSK